ncbi:hypothetical protein [Marinobacterium arenosum]|uniref:hypothetical protein n=1 Tax=Marinobacterium arenosum TaxID=2862496 RepID=UPI001C94BD86|nr:hypothetical protein [Marinobacterium arenosum]MBY4678559.1 hypothetical protein [Marinobacterium arenosum]
MRNLKLSSLFQAWILGIFLCLGSTGAFATHDLGLFQLEGNAVDGNAFPPDDWETLCDPDGAGNCQNPGPGPGPDASANVFTGIVTDPDNASIFTGGRKDIQDIPQWGWKNGAVPDKSDLTHAYAASYDDNGDLIVYFGADRIANAGDTFMGFWFFKSEVTMNNDGSFSGNHTNGDVLVLVNFPQATNAQPLVQVVEWDSSCTKADNNNPAPGDCVAQNLILRAGQSGAGAICGSMASDLVCAITNDEGGANDPTPSPWSYTSKDGFINQFPFETFFEGGINLTQLIGGDGCFASFMAETRSSSSFTASLKDFVLDAFPLCSIEVSKDCSNPRLNNAEDMIIYDITGTVTNTGSGTVHNVMVTDNPAFATGPVFSNGNAVALLGGATVDYSGTIEVTLANNGPSDTVTAVANTKADGTGTDVTAMASANCPPLQINPSINVSKACVSSVMVMDAKVVAQVSVSGEVCNDGDSTVSNISVVDNKAGTLLSGATLASGACQNYSGAYTPSVANDVNDQATTDPSAVVFKDTVTASGNDVFGAPVQNATADAECPLCP